MFFNKNDNLRRDIFKLNAAVKLAEMASVNFTNSQVAICSKEVVRFIRNGDIDDKGVPLLCFGLSVKVPEKHVVKLINEGNISVNGLEIIDGNLAQVPIDNMWRAMEDSTSIYELLDKAKFNIGKNDPIFKDCKKILAPKLFSTISETLACEISAKEEEEEMDR